MENHIYTAEGVKLNILIHSHPRKPPCLPFPSQLLHLHKEPSCWLLQSQSPALPTHSPTVLIHISRFTTHSSNWHLFAIGGGLTLSHVQLFNPMDCSLPGSFVHGISQARILKCVALSFSRGSSWPRDPTQVSCIAGDLLHCRQVLYRLSHQGSTSICHI